jgi:hypothetical protein
MKSAAKSIPEYLSQLPEDRKKAITKLRAVIRKNLPRGYEEAFNWGMITYQVPLKRLPNTYNGQPLCYAALASQKNHMAVYLMCVYGDEEINQWFRGKFKAAGKKLDMGRSCVRFRKLEDLPLNVIGEAIARVPMENYIRHYEASRGK